MIRKTLVLFLCVLLFSGVFNNGAVSADEITLTSYKNFPVSAENLYYSTISAIYYSGLKVNEIQSKAGFIVFTNGTRTLLAQIIPRTKESSDLKITPSDGNYQAVQWIIDKIFQSVSTVSQGSFSVI